MSPKKFWVQKFFGVKNNFCVKIIFLGQTNFQGQIHSRDEKVFSVPKNVVPKKNFSEKMFEVKKIDGSKKMLDQQKFDPKKF